MEKKTTPMTAHLTLPAVDDLPDSRLTLLPQPGELDEANQEIVDLHEEHGDALNYIQELETALLEWKNRALRAERDLQIAHENAQQQTRNPRRRRRDGDQ